jgi:hypothetical protein
MAKSPKSLGEALIALHDDTLTTGWRSSFGIEIEAYAA